MTFKFLLHNDLGMKACKRPCNNCCFFPSDDEQGSGLNEVDEVEPPVSPAPRTGPSPSSCLHLLKEL